MEKQNNAGAIASNAGVDFHLIWAGKKLLDTLKPNSKLRAISFEGPTWADSIEIEDEQKLYSIDLDEYYGAIDFEQANSVIFSLPTTTILTYRVSFLSNIRIMDL